MAYGSHPYGGVAYAASEPGGNPETNTDPILSIEIAFTTGALETPVWETVTADVRFWDVSRGRTRELERMQPGRATIVLSNLSRQYDSVNAAGPHFGDVRPGRRIRIRETFNGVTYPVFDGFIDRWQLNYPGVGHDATATVTATDGFKIFTRTDLGPSVYDAEVAADNPVSWWKLDDVLSATVTVDSVTDDQGSYIGWHDPEDSLVVRDPGAAQTFPTGNTGAELTGLSTVLNGLGTDYTIEFWCRTLRRATTIPRLLSNTSTATAGTFEVFVSNFGGPEGSITWDYIGATGIVDSSVSLTDGSAHHVVLRTNPSGSPRIYVDGVDVSVNSSGSVSVAWPTAAQVRLVYVADPALVDPQSIDHVAVYAGQLSDARIAAHYAAGTTPWDGDTPAERIDRVLDLVDWPATLRELDPGLATFQSTDLDQTALEHLQKVAETEFGTLFVTRDGKVRFLDQTAVFNRVSQGLFGDDGAEVGYRAFVPDDGDATIRNRATISRLDGVAKTAVDATSVTEFGRFQYTLEGLLHDTETWSQDYADFIAAEYGDPRRRIVSMTLGPAVADEEGVLYPAILGRELGDMVTVRNRPVGGGAVFEQACVIEGIRISASPKVLTVTWALSPDLTGVF